MEGRGATLAGAGLGVGWANSTKPKRAEALKTFFLKPRSKRSFENIRFDESNPGCEPILRLQNLPKLAGRGITTDRKRTFAENVGQICKRSIRNLIRFLLEAAKV